MWILRFATNSKLGSCLMAAPVKKIVLPQIMKFYYTMVKVNEGCYKVKVNKKYFHLRSDNIAQLLVLRLLETRPTLSMSNWSISYMSL